ncbi:germinal-center associated nuclear protein [Polypterus senegalus]|uniref:germinal-center associated nuclear protein n=1 Tax=Polypterus senegalus TaxID=55291 RepID=UPI0019629328|nr:germinal-center associated nuclear protein [Polypterus senegalus]
MNTNNPFGSQQQQSPFQSNVPSGIFGSQSPFGQQGFGNTGQNPLFGQTSAFGQQSAFSQSGAFGTLGQPLRFGQSSAFGQSPVHGQGSAFGQGLGSNQTPALSQVSSQASGTGQPPPYTQSFSFGQSSGLGQAPVGFGPPPAYSQSNMMSQSPAFGQTQGLGQQPSAFSNPSGITLPLFQNSSSSTSAGSSQNMGFTKSDTPSFGQPTPSFTLPLATSASEVKTPATKIVTFSLPPSSSTNIFSASSSGFGGIDAPPHGFGKSEFSFRPIFASPGTSSQQQQSAPFGSNQPSTSGSSSTTNSSVFSLSAATSGEVSKFSFPQPVFSSSGSSGVTSVSQESGRDLQFNFSHSVAPSTSNSSMTLSQAATSVGSLPSFSFSDKNTDTALTPKSAFAVSGAGVNQPMSSASFSSKNKQTDELVKPDDSQAQGVSYGISKGLKRKDEFDDRGPLQMQDDQEDGSKGTSSGTRLPPKRSLVKLQGPTGGLFRSALSGLLKASSNHDPKKTEVRHQERGETEKTSQAVHLTRSPHRPSAPLPRGAAEKPKEHSDDSSDSKTPSRRVCRSQSTDSLGGLSPSEFTSIACKNIPSNLNKREIIEKHFSRFGRVQKIYCRPQKNLAIVHFHDHASASKAKKKGKSFHRQEIAIFWHKKKLSPKVNLEQAPRTEQVDERRGSFQSSPVRKVHVWTSAASSSGVNKGSPVKKSSVTKSLLFESEPRHDSGAEDQGLDRVTGTLPASVSVLFGKVAETSEDRYQLLEQRDKIMRQGRLTRTELDLSKVFVGTCPDMCPEKERYMRETRNQLSIFEVIPGTEKVDHAAAVKEYSRSSADQEEPLSHDLRPPAVLSMTMDYLVTRIMDQGEGNYRDWYDFVWNRTRGIRKDITQQHLCDPLTVSLIEKCARFHIHCAHHLCEEPMMSFDAKINNENMTKCLQSLKEMYQDLANKGIHCQGEPEFRQYMILVKLNEGDILREVQQFRAEIRNSPEVKYAVQVFAALNSNNFVRFFKLVRRASYLSSCILHRYFKQVRQSALKALNIAYTVSPQRSTAFPIDGLIQMLMFQDADDASEFVVQHGLVATDGMVELSRLGYQEPEVPMHSKKSADILQKRTMLIGEVVNGGHLPTAPKHTPVSSFDARNKYIGDMVTTKPSTSVAKAPFDATAIIKPEPMPVLCTPSNSLIRSVVQSDIQPTISSLPAAKPQPIYSDQDIADVVLSLVDDVVKAECMELSNQVVDYARAALKASETTVHDLVSDVVDQLVLLTSTEEINEEKQRIEEEKRRIEEARLKQEMELFITLFSQALCSQLTEDVLMQSIKEIAASEISQAKQEKAACISRCTDEVCSGLIEETLSKEIHQLAKETLQKKVQCVRMYMKRWRDVVAVRRQLKRQMRGFPAAPCCVDPRNKLKAFSPSAQFPSTTESLAKGLINLGNAGNISVSCTRLMQLREKSAHQMRVLHYYQELVSEASWTPLDLPALIVGSMLDYQELIFWKAIILLPSIEDCQKNITNRILSDWLKSKFSSGDKQNNYENDEDEIQTLSLCSNSKVHICIKSIHGPLSDYTLNEVESQKELLGTSAILMLLPSLQGIEPNHTEEEDDVYWLSALLQLKQVLQAKPFQPALPLVVMVPQDGEGVDSDELLKEGLMLQDMVDAQLISDYIFVYIPESTNDLRGSKMVCSAVKWLASQCPPTIQLQSQTLMHFIEDGFCREFGKRFYHDKTIRKSLGLHSQDPISIIELYNSVVHFLAELISCEQLSEISWPAKEFTTLASPSVLPHKDWNTSEHLVWLKKAVLNLQLPEMKYSRAQDSLLSQFLQYASQIPTCAETQAVLLSKVKHLHHNLCTLETGSEMQLPDQAPWDDFILLCIDHCLSDWKSPGLPVNQEAVSEDGQIMVYYIKEDLHKYTPPCTWESAVLKTHREALQISTEATHHSTLSSANQFSSEHLRNSESCSQSSVHLEDSRLSSTEGPPHDLSAQETLFDKDKLLCMLEDEKIKSQRFEEYLHKLQEVDPVESFSMPLYIPHSLITTPEMIHFSSPSPRPLVTKESPSGAPKALDTESSGLLATAPVSIDSRLEELKRRIKASQEEDKAFRIHLSNLVDIVNI